MRALLLALALVASSLVSCERSRGTGQYGDRCQRDGDCATSLCISAGPSADEGRCTRSCATDEDCPRGSSCRGATNTGVVVCLPGPAVPFAGQ